MRDLGYEVHAVRGKNLSHALSKEDIFVILRKLGYADFLFLPASSLANAEVMLPGSPLQAGSVLNTQRKLLTVQACGKTPL